MRFVVDADGARFDSCSADTDRARTQILRAATAAGVEGAPICQVGLGTPTPRWADAVALAIKAVKELGSGSITFSDADVTLLAGSDVPQATFDKAVKVTVFLTDIGDFKQVNEVYGSVFKEPYPARSAIQVAALPMGADVEIEAVLAV